MSLIEASKVYKPFKYPWAVNLAIDSEDMHWHEKEANLEYDVAQWKGIDPSNALLPKEKNHITQILKLFTQLDVAVGTNYIENYLPKFKNNEIRAMLSSITAREFIHQRAYAILNDTLGIDESEYSAFLEIPEMMDQVDFILKLYDDSPEGLALSVAKSVFNEGVALFASFVMLLNYKRSGKMLGMCDIVEWSIKDEAHHCDCMTKLFRVYCEENSNIVNDKFKSIIYDMARDVVKVEERFTDLAYEMGDIEGLHKEEVKQYVKYIADRRLIQLGLKPNFNINKNPLPWVDQIITARQHGNFFETRITDYSVSGMSGDWD